MRTVTKNIYYSSVLTGEIPGIPSIGSACFFSDSSVKVYGTNLFISQLYQIAFASKLRHFLTPDNPDFYLDMAGRVLLEVKDSSAFYWAGKKALPGKDLAPVFCYDLMLPKNDSAIIKNYMLQDLNRIFGAVLGIYGRLEKRKVKCWALIKFKNDDKLHSTGGTPKFKKDGDAGSYSMKNQTINYLMFHLCLFEFMDNPVPIINDTHDEEPVDIDFTADLSNIQSVSKALEKYGLRFVETEKELDMIVIKDKSPNASAY
jgi:hypothetical protein